MKELYNCKLCPRKCGVNRYKTKGICGATNKLRIALASKHFFEEPCISGKKGSGTIFFSYCNLKCVYCQNYKISEGYGKDISIKRFKDICLELQEKGVHNINLVTPTHYIPHIIRGIKKAKKEGLNIPIVYNTSGYESVESLEKLSDIVDIYLTDFKYYDNELGFKYSNIKNYFEVTSKALDEMIRQCPKNIMENGLLKKGIIVRVLLLPNHLEDSKKILKYLHEKYDDKIYISIMNQYTPVRITKYINLNRKVTQNEYEKLIDYALSLGIKNAFVQENGTQDESFIPIFDKRGV